MNPFQAEAENLILAGPDCPAKQFLQKKGAKEQKRQFLLNSSAYKPPEVEPSPTIAEIKHYPCPDSKSKEGLKYFTNDEDLRKSSIVGHPGASDDNKLPILTSRPTLTARIIADCQAEPDNLPRKPVDWDELNEMARTDEAKPKLEFMIVGNVNPDYTEDFTPDETEIPF